MAKTESTARHPADSESATRTSFSLISRAKENHSEAWERITQLYSPMVYFWCRESGLSEPDLRDVLQEVFQALVRNIHQFKPIGKGTFRGWLRTITRNKLNDHFRKAGREPRPVGGTDALNYLEQFPADSVRQTSLARTCDSSNGVSSEEIKLQHALLCQALASIRPRFSEQTWQAFWSVVIDGRETSDVASELAMRPGTVRVAKSRVLKRLRLEIGDTEG